jgi:adenine-specific DNA-methyltransferase
MRGQEGAAMPDPFQLPREHREWLGEAARDLRRRQTDTEERLWQAVRNRQLAGARFKRQQPVGPFVVDFFCPKACLVVEVDGAVHDAQQEYDAERDVILEQAGYRILRVTADEVERDLASVLSRIRSVFTLQMRSDEASSN